MPERKPYVHMCGVPKDKCAGSMSNVNAGLGGTRKVHSSPQAAFSCHKNYLLGLGYTLIDSRAFSPPDGGAVRILTKPSRFGAVLRNGKEGTRNMSNTKIRGGGRRSGNIVSC